MNCWVAVPSYDCYHAYRVNVSDLVSWEGSEEGQMPSIHHLLPLWPEVEVFGLWATAKEQDIGCRGGQRRGALCQSCEMMRTDKIHVWNRKEISPVFPSATLSCKADLKGATPVPGPTIITGVSFSLGNFRLPFFTHRGTYTSPATPLVVKHRVSVEAQCVSTCHLSDITFSQRPCAGSREANQVEQSPLRGLYSLVLYRTTATRIWSLCGWACVERTRLQNTSARNHCDLSCICLHYYTWIYSFV